MALVLSRRNGAPLGGALFVANPRNRKNRRKAKRSTRKGMARKTARKAFMGKRKKMSAATRKRMSLAAKKAWRRRKRMGTKKGMARKTSRRAYSRKNRRNAVALRTNRRNAVALRTNRKNRKNRRNALAVKVNRRNRRNAVALRTNRRNPRYIQLMNKRNRRNARYIQLMNKRNRRNRRNRRNTSASLTSFKLGGMANRIYKPIDKLLKKIPLIGKPIAQALPAAAFGVAAGAVHHYSRPYILRGLNAVSPTVARYTSPYLGFLSGVVVASLLQMKWMPGSAALKKQLGAAAVLTGAGYDTANYFGAFSGDMSGIGAYIDPEYTPHGSQYIDPEYNGYGDGGAYDVMTLGALAMEYNGASPADAASCPADLSVSEGEAALAGPMYWKQSFGPPPHRSAGKMSAYSNLAGREGHRWGWLISMIGFDRFQKIASLSPQARIDLLAQLKAQAITIADAQIAQMNAPTAVADTGALAMDMGGVLYAGAM